MVFSIFTSMKVFSDPWVGNPALNRLGLHKRRLRAARAVTAFRRLQSVRARTTAERALLDQGYAVIEDFLAPAEFKGGTLATFDIANADESTPQQTPQKQA
ncbi:MAG: hypothetical protein H7X93_09260, partial [Sphingomonadaceae bacterium]|nr:hypothetical protein [Sphingomonadaceae bacterium]